MSREAFEAWYAKNHWSMLSATKEDAASLWQDAQADAYERAAKVCEHQADEPECPERAFYCADAIRALAKEAT